MVFSHLCRMAPADPESNPHSGSKLSQTIRIATQSPRLLSLDALRGFDMFWIVGAEDIVHALHKVNPSPAVNLLTQQLSHKDWEGVAFYDLIFPLFVFIVGVSLVFSLSKTLLQHGQAAAYRRVMARGLLLYLLGLFYYGGFAEGIERIRLFGVLQRIGLAYLFGGLLFCTFRLRGLIVACALLLGGYWLLMTFVPVPGVGAGSFQEGANLANYIDKQYVPLRKWDGDHDPEGLLSTLPAIGTCLLGVFAGLLLQNSRISEQKKVLWLLLAGVAGVGLGFLWGLQFPVIKKLWTSSYVLVAAGYSCLFLALFHQVIEVWRIQKWAMPFVWIGLNPLTLYLVHNVVELDKIANRFVGGPIKASFGSYSEVIVTATILAITFWLAHFLYRRKIFLRL
jgi:predicted acyltransferase